MRAAGEMKRERERERRGKERESEEEEEEEVGTTGRRVASQPSAVNHPLGPPHGCLERPPARNAPK